MARSGSDEERSKKRRGMYFAMSLITAIVIWCLVTFTTDTDITKTVHDVKVVYTGEQALKEKGFVVTDAAADKGLWVKLSGRRGDLIDTIDRVRVELDVSGITEAGETELEGTVKTYNSQVYIMKKSFTYVPVTIEEYETKEIPITVKQIGSFKNNPVVSTPEFASVVIAGAKSEIDRVSSGCVTVDLSKLAASDETVSGVVLMDDAGDVITDAKTIESSVSGMKISNVVCEYAELPVKVMSGRGLPEGVTVDEERTETEPETVKVGIMPGYSFSEVKVYVGEYTDEEIECEISERDGMYVPESEKKVRVRPVFKNAASDGGE